jgi:hypothetical protein
LVSASRIGRFDFARPFTMARLSSFSPARASTSSRARSASCAPPQAAATIARSSRRRGWKMPGVSTSTIWLPPRITTARMRKRVVCGLGETIVTLVPASALTSVDLPAFGAPTTATSPQRVGGGAAGLSAGTS